MKHVQQLLEQHGLRKTAVRATVLHLFLSRPETALSSQDIERELGEMDRITLYRTLKTFEEKGLIHEAIDGGTKTKYALCPEACNVHEHHHEHAHFRCNACGKTTCLEEVHTPPVHAPRGFRVEQAHLVLEGKCDQCLN